jgi:hypothetical protein
LFDLVRKQWFVLGQVEPHWSESEPPLASISSLRVRRGRRRPGRALNSAAVSAG